MHKSCVVEIETDKNTKMNAKTKNAMHKPRGTVDMKTTDH